MVNPRFGELSVNRPELKAIYAHLCARLGGDAGARAEIAGILREFYQRMSRDVLLGFFFDGHDLEAIARKQGEFILRAFGAEPSYTGKPPAQAHEALAPILRGHFDRRLVILEETLRAHGLPPEDIRVWIAFEDAFRDSVQHG